MRGEWDAGNVRERHGDHSTERSGCVALVMMVDGVGRAGGGEALRTAGYGAEDASQWRCEGAAANESGGCAADEAQHSERCNGRANARMQRSMVAGRGAG